MSRLTRSSSPGLRYRKAHVCEHLASQYVTGLMTPRVRARLETLLPITPELNRAVAFWSDKVAGLQHNLPEVRPSSDLWKRIDRAIPNAESSSQDSISKETSSWWHNLFFWQATGFTGVFASLALALILFTSGLQQDSPSQALTPNYMAAMSAHGVNGATSEGEKIAFVVNAYKKTEDRPSTLFVQWSQDETDRLKGLNLWAEDKVSGELTYIGTQPPSGEAWHLDKTRWQAISNSSRLLVTRDENLPTSENTLFSGPCIQLSEWKVQNS